MSEILAKFKTLTPDEAKAARARREARPAVKRTHAYVRDRGLRRLIVTVYPSGLIGLRPERMRREETLNADDAYAVAVKQRVARERAERKAKQKGAK